MFQLLCNFQFVEGEECSAFYTRTHGFQCISPLPYLVFLVNDLLIRMFGGQYQIVSLSQNKMNCPISAIKDLYKFIESLKKTLEESLLVCPVTTFLCLNLFCKALITL